jgi:DNA processing protein
LRDAGKNVPVFFVELRRPTAYGTQMAERLARELAKRGLVIVSGLARGVDALAYQGRWRWAAGQSV